MKRWIAVLIVLSLLLGISAGFAEEDAAKDVENARQALAEIFGEPETLTVQRQGFDDINARYMYIGYKALGADLCLVIRKSETEVYFWALSLTQENFTQAKAVFSEDAPICCIQYYEGTELKVNGVYSRQVSSVLPYDEFLGKVDEVENTVLPKESRQEIAKSDPIFSYFSGVKWGMSRDEVINTCGRGKFLMIGSSDSSSLMARPTIYMETVIVGFTFGSANKLNMIMVSTGGENIDLYKSSYSLAYGKGHQTTLTGALNAMLGGTIKDDPSGNCYAWRTSDTLIIVDENVIQYWALN